MIPSSIENAKDREDYRGPFRSMNGRILLTSLKASLAETMHGDLAVLRQNPLVLPSGALISAVRASSR